MAKIKQHRVVTTVPKHQGLRTHTGPFLFGLFRRTFVRIIILPIYAFLAAPWLFIMLMTTEPDGAIQKTIFKGVAILSGQPNTTYINEDGLARAVFVLFLLISTVLEVYRYFTKDKQSNHTGIANKHRLITQASITSTGWVIAAFLFYGHMGLMGSLIALFFALVTPFLFVPEFLFRETLTHIRPNP